MVFEATDPFAFFDYFRVPVPGVAAARRRRPRPAGFGDAAGREPAAARALLWPCGADGRGRRAVAALLAGGLRRLAGMCRADSRGREPPPDVGAGWQPGRPVTTPTAPGRVGVAGDDGNVFLPFDPGEVMTTSGASDYRDVGPRPRVAAVPRTALARLLRRAPRAAPAGAAAPAARLHPRAGPAAVPALAGRGRRSTTSTTGCFGLARGAGRRAGAVARPVAARPVVGAGADPRRGDGAGYRAAWELLRGPERRARGCAPRGTSWRALRRRRRVVRSLRRRGLRDRGPRAAARRRGPRLAAAARGAAARHAGYARSAGARSGSDRRPHSARWE